MKRRGWDETVEEGRILRHDYRAGRRGAGAGRLAGIGLLPVPYLYIFIIRAKIRFYFETNKKNHKKLRKKSGDNR